MDAGKNEIVGDDFKVREGEAKLAMSGGLRIPGQQSISLLPFKMSKLSSSRVFQYLRLH